MPSCAFLTIDDLDGYVTDDELAVEPLREFGWDVEFVPWRQAAAEPRHDAAVIRTTWDYHYGPREYLDALEALEASGRPLANSAAVARWNHDKRYLLQLHDAGLPVVPSEVLTGPEGADLEPLYERWDATRLVVKPTVGASASDTYVLNRGDERSSREPLQRLEARSCLVQPFIAEVATVGEYSLMFFRGAYSHAVLKRPAAEDFRTQEEHGATIDPVEAPRPVVNAAQAILAARPEDCLYARVDLVDTAADGPLLMELELIEPALYLRADPRAPERFAAAIVAWYDAATAKPTAIDSASGTP